MEQWRQFRRIWKWLRVPVQKEQLLAVRDETWLSLFPFAKELHISSPLQKATIRVTFRNSHTFIHHQYRAEALPGYLYQSKRRRKP
jgi:hypothetical protein